ncbi:MAG: phosphoribosylformylglycinamidine synthase subunit PurQ [Dehalococcoidia bacterium]|nr:phosphoribosylformylglycinamidine synthase subunit PurQ [Dehalococcoidia bacterium]
MRFAILVFPGTLNDGDCYHVLSDVLGQEVRYVWHKERDLSGFDCLVLAGGFSYGDHLRAGAIARFSPAMEAVSDFANHGGLVLGICNGFQILCEAGLLPGVLMRNRQLQFRCQWVHLRTENANTAVTNNLGPGQVLRVPIAHGEGNYYADPPTLQELETAGRVLFRYCNPDGQITEEANPNGSLGNIAGIMNKAGNVFGMMPHPERCSEAELGGTDGLYIWRSLLNMR